ncbi:MAG: hypothetical protein HYR85_00645 [Planctomycetes bacterium]|nr:hypothetical protein [Planctomycetota bacterium]MBI3847507.1 hypothetical protein [Planctomycetota bacterium]
MHSSRGFIVVKDFFERGFVMRNVFGPILIRREARAYRRLEGIEGIPRFLGRLDRHALVLEYIEGRTLSGRERGRLDGAFFAEMDATLRRIHDRGIVHCDLRQKRNVLVTPDDRPIIVDFAASVRFGRGPISRACLVPLLGWIDRGGVLKLRNRVAPECASPRERSLARLVKWLGRLWLPSAVRRLRTRGNLAPLQESNRPGY